MTAGTVTHPTASIDAATRTFTTDTRNLYQRLASVRVALGGEIDKGGTAPREMGGFKFIAWDDVAEKIGGFMADAGVMMIPSERRTTITEAGVTSTGKTIWRATVWLDLLFVNVDNPNETHSLSWCGVGDDTSDKSVQKAITSATKYALLKLFLLSGADDADASDVTAAERPAQPRGDGTTNARQAERPKAGKGALCPLCAEQGWLSSTKLNPTFWPADRGPHAGQLQCNGRTPDGGYANHLAPLAEGEEVNDPTPIPGF